MTYCEKLESRIVELLAELANDDERRVMMREIESAALESGIYMAPSPDPANPSQWALNLVSGNPSMTSLIQNKIAFEWMPHPSHFENLDEIVSAIRPSHSLD